jgi:glutamate:GABA antiporter
LFIVFLIHRRRSANSGEVVLTPGGSIGGWLAGLSGIITTLFAMIIATIPPPGIGDSLLFRLKVIGGALGFILIGGFIYWCARLKEKYNKESSVTSA